MAAVATAIAAAAFPKADRPRGRLPARGDRRQGQAALRGSIPTGEVRRIDAKTGNVDPLCPRAARSRRKAFVYDARTGEDLAQFQLTAPTPGGTFVNDVALTRKAACFTDSRRSVL